MKISYMKEYITLAKKLNFTEAANELFITQPALSKHLSYIEEAFGMPLLIRTTHAVELTPEGKVVYEDFKRIVSDYNKLLSKIQTIKSGMIGNLSIGMLYYAVSEYIEPLVEQFQKTYLNIDLSIKSCQPYQIFQSISEDIIDIGLIMRFDSMVYPNYAFYPLKKERLVAVTLTSHPFTRMNSVSLTEISQEKLVVLTLEKEYSECITQLLLKYNALPNNFVNAEQIDMLPLILQKTNGVFIGPALLRNMPRKDLAFTDIDSDEFCFEMCFCYKSSNENPLIQLFLRTWDDLNKL